MKSLVFALVVAFAFVAVSAQFFPIRNCPPGEHSVLYCPQTAEPSCDNPTVHELPPGVAGVCDTPDCFCNVPNVRDTRTNKCIPLSEC